MSMRFKVIEDALKEQNRIDALVEAYGMVREYVTSHKLNGETWDEAVARICSDKQYPAIIRQLLEKEKEDRRV